MSIRVICRKAFIRGGCEQVCIRADEDEIRREDCRRPLGTCELDSITCPQRMCFYKHLSIFDEDTFQFYDQIFARDETQSSFQV